MRSKVSLLLFFTVVLALFPSCKHEVESVVVIPDNITINVGATYQLRAVVKPDKASQETSWISSDPTIAVVSSNGLVTAIAEGTCEISVYADVQKAVCRVSVKSTSGGDQPEGEETPKDTIISDTVKGVCFHMIYVKGGSFTMGATPEQGDDANDNEKPMHRVALSDYYIGQTEVTQALWEAVMGSNPSHVTGANLPVDKVSWTDCQTFIRKLDSLTGKTFRLPTEAEWEFAARGGFRSKGFKYSGSNDLDAVAWYDNNANGQAHPVAQKRANELGLYDMSGNVREWCQDWYALYTNAQQTNPVGPTTGTDRVYRGGSWYNSALGCRVSRRSPYRVEDSMNNLGLRLVLVQ